MSLGFFDPHSLALHPGQTLYSEAHEWAHVRQCAKGTIFWRLLGFTRETAYLGRFALLAMETEAALMATAELLRCRLWQPQDGREALQGLRSYLRALFL